MFHFPLYQWYSRIIRYGNRATKPSAWGGHGVSLFNGGGGAEGETHHRYSYSRMISQLVTVFVTFQSGNESGRNGGISEQ